MTTELEIIDTAVKVGLGAAVSAFGSYVLAVANHKREAQRTLTTEKINLLKECATAIEEAYAETNSALQNIYLIRDHKKSDTTLDKELGRYVEAINKNRRAKVYSQLLGLTNLTDGIDELFARYSEEYKHLSENGLNSDFSVTDAIGEKQGEIKKKIGVILGEVFAKSFA